MPFSSGSVRSKKLIAPALPPPRRAAPGRARAGMLHGLLTRRAPEQVEDHTDRDQHGQRHDLRELVLQALVREAQCVERVVGVRMLAEPVHAEARPDERHGGQQRPERGQHRQDPGHSHAARHPVGPLDVGVRVAQTHERRKDEQVRDGGRRDGQAEHRLEVAVGVAAGQREGEHHEHASPPRPRAGS